MNREFAAAVNAALAREIKRLPLWRFQRERVKSWVLSVPVRPGAAGAMARVTPVMASDCDGVGSWMHGKYEPGMMPGELAAQMVDRLLADPKFATSTGTPVQ